MRRQIRGLTEPCAYQRCLRSASLGPIPRVLTTSFCQLRPRARVGQRNQNDRRCFLGPQCLRIITSFYINAYTITHKRSEGLFLSPACSLVPPLHCTATYQSSRASSASLTPEFAAHLPRTARVRVVNSDPMTLRYKVQGLYASPLFITREHRVLHPEFLGEQQTRVITKSLRVQQKIP